MRTFRRTPPRAWADNFLADLTVGRNTYVPPVRNIVSGTARILLRCESSLFRTYTQTSSRLTPCYATQNARGPVDTIWSLGDMVGYGPHPNECLDTLRGFDHVSVAGNHDLGAIGRHLTWAHSMKRRPLACEWNGAQLTAENRAYLEGLPRVVKQSEFTLAHGSLRDPVWEYLIHEEAARASFDLLETPFLLVGHSHLPLIFEEIITGPNSPSRVHAMGRLNHGSLIHLPNESSPHHQPRQRGTAP